MSNAERQKAYRQRRKQELAQAAQDDGVAGPSEQELTLEQRRLELQLQTLKDFDETMGWDRRSSLADYQRKHEYKHDPKIS